MSDPNLPPVTPPPATPPPATPPPATPPAYQPSSAPAYQQPYAQQVGPKYNVLAIVSLVSAFFISLAAIITGHIALGQIKRTGEQGRLLAIWGLILGYVGFVAGAIAIAFYVIFFVFLAGHGAFEYY